MAEEHEGGVGEEQEGSDREGNIEDQEGIEQEDGLDYYENVEYLEESPPPSPLPSPPASPLPSLQEVFNNMPIGMLERLQVLADPLANPQVDPPANPQVEVLELDMLEAPQGFQARLNAEVERALNGGPTGVFRLIIMLEEATKMLKSSPLVPIEAVIEEIEAMPQDYETIPTPERREPNVVTMVDGEMRGVPLSFAVARGHAALNVSVPVEANVQVERSEYLLRIFVI